DANQVLVVFARRTAGQGVVTAVLVAGRLDGGLGAPGPSLVAAAQVFATVVAGRATPRSGAVLRGICVRGDLLRRLYPLLGGSGGSLPGRLLGKGVRQDGAGALLV